MTQQFQEMLFADFGYDRSKIVDFNMKPEDRKLQNTTMFQYEYAVFEEGDKYVKTSTYMLPLEEGMMVRLYVKTTGDTSDEFELFKKELQDEGESVETFVVGRHVTPAKEFFDSLEEENGKDENKDN